MSLVGCGCTHPQLFSFHKTGLQAHELAYQLDSLVCVSRRVKMRILLSIVWFWATRKDILLVCVFGSCALPGHTQTKQQQQKTNIAKKNAFN